MISWNQVFFEYFNMVLLSVVLLYQQLLKKLIMIDCSNHKSTFRFFELCITKLDFTLRLCLFDHRNMFLKFLRCIKMVHISKLKELGKPKHMEILSTNILEEVSNEKLIFIYLLSSNWEDLVGDNNIPWDAVCG